MKKVFDWFLWSSANPDEIATTVKGIVIGVIPFLMTFLPYIGLHSSADLQNVPDIMYGIIFYGLTAISCVITAFGFCRKLWFALATWFVTAPKQ